MPIHVMDPVNTAGTMCSHRGADASSAPAAAIDGPLTTSSRRTTHSKSLSAGDQISNSMRFRSGRSSGTSPEQRIDELGGRDEEKPREDKILHPVDQAWASVEHDPWIVEKN
jgi:hypothetical protein